MISNLSGFVCLIVAIVGIWLLNMLLLLVIYHKNTVLMLSLYSEGIMSLLRCLHALLEWQYLV